MVSALLQTDSVTYLDTKPDAKVPQSQLWNLSMRINSVRILPSMLAVFVYVAFTGAAATVSINFADYQVAACGSSARHAQ